MSSGQVSDVQDVDYKKLWHTEPVLSRVMPSLKQVRLTLGNHKCQGYFLIFKKSLTKIMA